MPFSLAINGSTDLCFGLRVLAYTPVQLSPCWVYRNGILCIGTTDPLTMRLRLAMCSPGLLLVGLLAGSDDFCPFGMVSTARDIPSSWSVEGVVCSISALWSLLDTQWHDAVLPQADPSSGLARSFLCPYGPLLDTQWHEGVSLACTLSRNFMEIGCTKIWQGSTSGATDFPTWCLVSALMGHLWINSCRRRCRFRV